MRWADRPCFSWPGLEGQGRIFVSCAKLTAHTGLEGQEKAKNMFTARKGYFLLPTGQPTSLALNLA